MAQKKRTTARQKTAKQTTHPQHVTSMVYFVLILALIFLGMIVTRYFVTA